MTDRILTKQPSESRLYDIDFTPLLATGDEVATIVSTTVSPVTVPALSVAAGAVATPKTQHRISAGLDGTLYTITEKITTTGGDALETEARLRVEDS
jgi:hypothetical protein